MSTLKVNTIQDTTGDTALTFDSSGNTTISKKLSSVNGNNFPSAGALSHRNLIINGAMQVDQRNTALTGNSGYTLDRWKCEKDGMDQLAWSIAQSTESPAGFSNSLHVDITTAETTVDGQEYAVISQRVEAQDLQHINSGTSDARSVTLSFWVKSPKTGNHSVYIDKADSTNRHINKTYTVSSANTWEKKTLTFPGDTDSSGTIANDNGVGWNIGWNLAAGSGATSTDSSSWVDWTMAGFAYGHAVNCVDNASNNFYLTGVQLEVGDTATDFEHRSYGDELLRCQRYCWVQGGTDTYTTFANGTIAGSTSFEGRVGLPTTMRAKPSVTFSGNMRVWDAGPSVSTTAVNIDSGAGSPQSIHHTATCSSASFTTGRSAIFGAENDTSAKIIYAAEP